MVKGSDKAPVEGDVLAALRHVRARLNAWHYEQALPLWAARGVHEGGGFFEALDFSGKPVPSDVARVRVQARQIAVFAAAHAAGWEKQRARALVDEGLRFMLRACRREDGLFGRKVDLRKGQLADPTADLYDTAFCLFAMAGASRVLGGGVESLMADCLGAIDTVLPVAPGRGYRESLPPPAHRAQNPHMHLAEALLAVAAVTQGRLGRAQLDALFAFIEAEFFETAAGWVKERTDGSGQSLEQSFEPGHSFEWIWLLGQRMALAGGAFHDFQRRLYARALSAGGPKGGVVMTAALDGRAVDGSMRLWSQAEALRAHLESARQGAASTLARALHCATSLADDWLTACPVPGGWLDHLDSGGALRAKDIPASTYYHIVGALAALDEFCGAAMMPRNISA